MRTVVVVVSLMLLSAQQASQPGSPAEPIRVVEARIDPDRHDGGLPLVAGAEHIQVMRANRTRPQEADGWGWTYSHAPFLAHWNGRFYLQYLSNPFGEHLAPGQTFITTSTDGRRWSRPEPVFPVYHLRPGPISGHESGMAMMHQRMGFYVAPNGRLLVVGHYGHAPNPMGATGIGRVVREAHRDGTYGQIHFVRYNALAGRTEANTPRFPFYARSTDAGFVEACAALLADKLVTLQWREEDRADDGFFAVSGPVLQAPSIFHRLDGTAVALWKHAWTALSTDEGRSWSTPVQVPSLVTGGAKTWGQRTADGRFAMVYNPAERGRWPLAVAPSEDGITFGPLLLLNGEVPPRRFVGRAKDFGLQYVRGIAEGNGRPPGHDLWVTYSSNKEDIWISRVPLPLRHAEDRSVADTFDQQAPGSTLPDWHTYRPRWADVGVVAFPSARNHSLRLEDRDPYDHASAVRLFPQARDVEVRVAVHAGQARHGRLDIDLLSRDGQRVVQVAFEPDGTLGVIDGDTRTPAGRYVAGRWHQITIRASAETSRFDVLVDGRTVARGARFAVAASSLERIAFRTGSHRSTPTRADDRYGVLDDVLHPDDPAPLAVFHVDDVRVVPSPPR
ncbi:hypothetical protein [Luteitalea sp.]|uniref:hypothetical protein n=1 Tax=Luteitalea sp. TaxID=2004800 RepID=UPI0037C9431D